MSGDTSLATQRIVNDNTPEKDWLYRYGSFRTGEDNMDSWRVQWTSLGGSSYVVYGRKNEDPVERTFNTIKEMLFMRCNI